MCGVSRGVASYSAASGAPPSLMPRLVGVRPPLVLLLVGASLPTARPLSMAPQLRVLYFLVVVLSHAPPPVGPLCRLRLDSWVLFRPLPIFRLMSAPLPLEQLLVGASLPIVLLFLMAPLLPAMSFFGFLCRYEASYYAAFGAPP